MCQALHVRSGLQWDLYHRLLQRHLRARHGQRQQGPRRLVRGRHAGNCSLRPWLRLGTHPLGPDVRAARAQVAADRGHVDWRPLHHRLCGGQEHPDAGHLPFLAGVCGASQLTVVPGVLADVYDHRSRGVAISLYALTVFGGPFVGPFLGGFIAASYLGWRWTLYIPAVLSLSNGAVSLFFLRETYAPCILVAKAVALRRRTGDGGFRAKLEDVEVSPREMIDKYFFRPLRMLMGEPILLLVSLYMSFIYGLVYCLLEGYPVVFEGVQGMAPGISGLPFLGLLIGAALGIGFVLSQHAAYIKKLVENDNVPVPEWRLRPTLLGAPVFTLGIFW